MNAGFVPWLLAAVLLPLAVNEFKDWWPRLAVSLVRWSARRLGDPHASARYEEEWVANLQEVPGKLSPLLAAFGYLVVVPRMRRTIRRGPVPLNVRPQQLPADIGAFVGRSHELAELDAFLFAYRHKRSMKRDTPVIVVAGTGGIGKTALILRWAHRNRDKFPDGHLYVNLRGYAREPLRPHEVLGRFLHSLGVRAAHIPATLDERAAVYRTLTARRRLLVVLDNTALAEQVRPLLPDSPKSVVVITSRSRLPAIVDRDARRLTIGTLDEEEGVELMRSVVGADRIDAELETVRKLIRLCGRLPLALRIVGGRAASRPQIKFSDLAKDLEDESDRLAELELGDHDGSYAVRPVFDLSYQALNADAARLFRRLGVLPGRQLARADAVHLAECTAEDTGRLLTALVQAHLLETTGNRDIFSVHPLLRAYAASVLADEEPNYVYPTRS